MSLGVPDPAILSPRSGSFRSAPAAFMHGHVRTAAASFANIVQQVPCHLTLCTIALVDDRLFLFTYPPFPPYLVDISGTAVLLSESPRRPCGNRRGAAVPKWCSTLERPLRACFEMRSAPSGGRYVPWIPNALHFLQSVVRPMPSRRAISVMFPPYRP